MAEQACTGSSPVPSLTSPASHYSPPTHSGLCCSQNLPARLPPQGLRAGSSPRLKLLSSCYSGLAFAHIHCLCLNVTSWYTSLLTRCKTAASPYLPAPPAPSFLHSSNTNTLHNLCACHVHVQRASLHMEHTFHMQSLCEEC